MPPVDPLPARDRSQGEPHTFGTLDGTVLLTIDIPKFDFHVTAKPAYDPKSMCLVLTQAEWWGLEPVEDDEVYVLEDGSTRQYLTPIIPVREVREVELSFGRGKALMAGIIGTALSTPVVCQVINTVTAATPFLPTMHLVA